MTCKLIALIDDFIITIQIQYAKISKVQLHSTQICKILIENQNNEDEYADVFTVYILSLLALLCILKFSVRFISFPELFLIRF